MSRTDTQFTYISGNDSSSLPRTVAVQERAVARRSSSVKSPLRRQRDVTSSPDVDATLCWSKSSFSVQKLAQEFDRRFPVLSRVIQAYRCSDVNSLKLSVGQVLLVHGVCSVQKRLRATNSAGLTFSLPLNLPITVQRLPSTASDDDVVSLSSAVTESTQLPVTVRCVAPVSDQSRDQYSALLDQQLTISKIYDSTFLLANPIHAGWLDAAETLIIPDDLSARLSVAEGLEGASDDEWLDYCGMFARAARSVKLSQFTDYKGFYCTSLDKRRPAEPAAAAAAVSRDADGRRLDVQPYIISRRHDAPSANVSGRFTKHAAVVPLEPRLSHRLSVLTQSHDSLNVVGADLRLSPTSRDPPCLTTTSRCSSVRDVRRPSSRRRRRSDVAETSFTEVSSSPAPAAAAAAARQHDIAVQVSLPRRSATPASVPQLPRMGRLVRGGAVPVGHHKSPSDDSVNALTTESGLGGSMPYLRPAENDLVAVEVRLPDVLVTNALSTSSSSSPGTGHTSMSVLPPTKTRSHHHLYCDDEGYLTKESTTSVSSIDISRHSPVFF